MGTHPNFESDFDCLTDMAGMNRPRARLNDQIYEEERRLEDLLSDSNELERDFSTIDFGSYQKENTMVQQKNENMLCGRDWIEDHLNYERRHHITDKEVESAAEFRRQNARDCQAEVKEETIIVFPKSSGPPLREVISQNIETGDRILEGRESPNPADMRDGRIVDYTLNKRLFPVPLFPNHQKLQDENDIRYARISVPSDLIKPTYKREIPMRSDDNEDSLCIWDHCIKGMEHRTHKTSSKTKNSLDLRSHMAPKAAVDVYKIQSGQSFGPGSKKKDPFNISQRFHQ